MTEGTAWRADGEFLILFGLVSRTLEKRETALVLARTVPVRTTGETRVRVQKYFLRVCLFACVKSK